MNSEKEPLVRLVNNMTTIIEVNNLFFQYTGMLEMTLEGITFSVQAGECLALLGTNGAGKTTLLYHLNGVIPHVIKGSGQGTVKVLGREVRSQTVSEICEKVGTILQDPEAQMLGTTVYSQCASHIGNLGEDRKTIAENVNQSLLLVGLSEYWRKNPRNLSYGQMQKLSLATSLTISPKLLLLDEPFSNVDAKTAERIVSLLGRLKRENAVTIVIATQESEYIKLLADRILVLTQGKISHLGEPRKVFKQLLREKSQIAVPRISALVDKLDLGGKVSDTEFPITVEEGYGLISTRIGDKKFCTGAYRKRNGTSPILSLKGVGYSYPDGTVALKDISFDVYPSEWLAIAGNNGAGKSTLANVFLRLLEPYTGSIIYDGTQLQKYPKDKLYDEIGLVLQHPEHQLLGRSVEQEVEEVLRNKGYDIEEIGTRTAESLKAVNLTHKRSAFSERLSYGEKKKLSMATVIASTPKVIILDEPSTGIDYQSRIDIAEALNVLKRKGCAVIVITHDMEFISEYADRIVILRNGDILKQGAPAEILRDTEIIQEASLKMPELARLSTLLNESFPSYSLQEVTKILREKMK